MLNNFFLKKKHFIYILTQQNNEFNKDTFFIYKMKQILKRLLKFKIGNFSPLRKLY